MQEIPVETPHQNRMAYSLLEAANILGISYATFWRSVKKGEVRLMKGLGAMRISHKELERILDSTGEYRPRKAKANGEAA
jgi:predicted site-specific integrase-resolvase